MINEMICLGDHRLVRVESIRGSKVVLGFARRSTDADSDPRLPERMALMIPDDVQIDRRTMTVDEAYEFGPDAKIVVVDIRGDRVRLGITAAHDLSVHRKEIAAVLRNGEVGKRWPHGWN
jgi:carbon storage regulator CsrA